MRKALKNNCWGSFSPASSLGFGGRPDCHEGDSAWAHSYNYLKNVYVYIHIHIMYTWASHVERLAILNSVKKPQVPRKAKLQGFESLGLMV